ncbi:hypothetical protein [Pontibacter russatus]|uniref:hypothetical protein n=1 Tax=Pontibacter russatus TaxID=2694929 RepID=UPI00137A27A4|nr:hypothetical protein [Pontibacter russatus]
MKLSHFFLLIALLFVVSCSSGKMEDELLGAWIPKHNTSGTFIFFPDSAWVLVRDTIKAYTYKIEDKELKIYSLNKQFGANAVVKESFPIRWLKEDSLILYHEVMKDVGVNLTYQKVNLFPERVDKIQFSYFNGWQISKDVEIDSAGNFTAWEYNFWTDETFKSTGLINEPDVIKILWGANFLTNLPASFEFSKNHCDDCAPYGLSVYKDGKVESFYASEAKKPSAANLVFSTLLDIIRKSEKIETDTRAPKLRSDIYITRDTTVIEEK